MRIIQFIDTLEMGGAERMAVNISNALNEDGNEILVIVSRKKGPLSKFLLENIPLASLKKINFFDLKAFIFFFKLVKNFKPNFIHAHGTSIYWAVIISWFFPSAKLLWHDHLGVNEEVKKNNPRNELKFLSRWIDGIITVNSNIRDWWILNLKYDPNSIRYIKNFPFLDLKSTPKTSEGLNIIHLANFRSEKGHLNLLKACLKLKSENISFKVRLVGQILEREVYETALKKIDEFSLQNYVELVGPKDDIASELSFANVGLVCSDREGLPVALLEYGLAKLQVVSTKVGNCPDVLGNGEFGYLVNPDDSDQLAKAIIHIENHQTEAQLKAEKFQEHVKKVYGSQQFLSEYYGFLKVIYT